MRRRKILLVEDDLIERMKFKKIVSAHDCDVEVMEVENGEEAFTFLEHAEQLPCVILLDINMPKMDGLQFIEKVKQNERFKFLPVVFLTTSSNDKDLIQAYELGGAGYMIKPLKYEDYKTMVKTIIEYWGINSCHNL